MAGPSTSISVWVCMSASGSKPNSMYDPLAAGFTPSRFKFWMSSAKYWVKKPAAFFDNASGDDSVAIVESAIRAGGWSAWAEVIALPRNGGFAYGNNRAIERARELDPAFAAIVCLNPDATVRPSALASLLGHLNEHPTAGIVGASIEDEHGVRQRSAHAFPSPLRELEGAAQLGILSHLFARSLSFEVNGDTAQTCDWVSGACFVVRREVFDSIGHFDEGYFLYFEEVDFCLRAKRAGWLCWTVPEAQIMHLEGASTGIRAKQRRRPEYWFASRRRYFTKAFGVGGLVAADVLWSLGRASLLLRRAVGLGGRAKMAPEPSRFAFDLLAGDAKAILRGTLLRDGNAETGSE